MAASDLNSSPFLQIIAKRRSIRRYEPKPISSSIIRLLLEACRWAPSGGNRQPWHVVVVRDPEKLRLVKSFSPGILHEPLPLVIAMAAEHPNCTSIMDIAMAAENIQLAATALGLGACAVLSFNRAAIAEILETPAHLEILLLVTIGFPKETPSPPEKKQIEQFTSLDSYGKPLAI